MKILGMCLIASAGLIFSQTAKKKYIDRLNADRVLKTIITDCINIIQNYPLSIEDILKRFAAEEYKPFNSFFENILNNMKTAETLSVSAPGTDEPNLDSPSKRIPEKANEYIRRNRCRCYAWKIEPAFERNGGYAGKRQTRSCAKGRTER